MTPRVLVGVIANDAARFSLFTACVMKLAYKMGRGNYEIAPEMLIGGDWCGARNNLVRMTLDGGYTHLWFMDDDHAFHEGMLDQLLSHDVALVNPLCCTRVAPFPLVTYSHKGDGELRYLTLSLEGAEDTGLVELEAGGCAGMLIRRDVLESIPEPWFEYSDRSEDIVFCEKAKGAGFNLYADLACRLGHITTAVVVPEYQEGKWMTLLNIGGLNVFVETAENMVEEESEELPADDASSYTTLPPEVETDDEEPQVLNVQYPCLICGKESVEYSASGVWACADHPGYHEAWKTYYERIEIWYVQEEGRWYARALNMAAQVAQSALTDRSWTQEANLVEELERDFAGVSVFHVTDELQNSRQGFGGGSDRFGIRKPPARMWTRDAQ